MSARWERRDLLKALAAGSACAMLGSARAASAAAKPALIIRNGLVTTLDPAHPNASAVAIADGRFIAVGADAEILSRAASDSPVIDAGGRRVIPGLMDSHTHVIRGGLNYNLELRWDGVPSLAEAMRLLREQAHRTPPPHWVRVVGGFSESQFAEKRLPTLAELNAAAPDTPVFILRLYDRALLNRAALRAVGYTKDTPDPPGGLIERDKSGQPTGMLVAKPNAALLYATLAKGPKLLLEEQMNSTRHFMRELNRLGVTSVIDAGGFQVTRRTTRWSSGSRARTCSRCGLAYDLFPQRRREELADFQAWARVVKPGHGNDLSPPQWRWRDAGVLPAADFEDFREPRPEMSPNMADGSRARRTPPGTGEMAVSHARDLRPDDRPCARCVRAREPRRADRGLALVFRSR